MMGVAWQGAPTCSHFSELRQCCWTPGSRPLDATVSTKSAQCPRCAVTDWLCWQSGPPWAASGTCQAELGCKACGACVPSRPRHCQWQLCVWKNGVLAVQGGQAHQVFRIGLLIRSLLSAAATVDDVKLAKWCFHHMRAARAGGGGVPNPRWGTARGGRHLLMPVLASGRGHCSCAVLFENI